MQQNIDLATTTNLAQSANMAGTESSHLFKQGYQGSGISIFEQYTIKDDTNFSYTVLNVPGRVLVVCAAHWNYYFHTTSVTGMTYGGVAMTLADRADGAYYADVDVYYLVNPPVGTNTIQITGGNGRWVVTAMTLTNVNTVDPIDVTDSGYGVAQSSKSLTLTTTVDDCFIIDAVQIEDQPGSAASGQTEIWNEWHTTGENGTGGGSYKIAGNAGQYTMQWTGDEAENNGIALVAVAFKPDTSAIGSANSARITAGADSNWQASDNTTWDSYLAFHTSKQGSVSEKVRITKDGDLVIKNSHLNFGSTEGDAGYGIRDNSGNVEVKNSGGAWSVISAIANFLGLPDVPSSFSGQNNKVLWVNASENALEFINPFYLSGGNASTIYCANLAPLDGGHSLSTF